MHFKFIVFKILSLLGIVSKYIKTEDIKKDTLHGIRKYFNFDEFKKEEEHFSSAPKIKTEEVKDTSTEMRDTDYVEVKHNKETIEEVNNKLSLNCPAEKMAKRQNIIDNIELTYIKDPEVYGEGNKSLLLLDDVSLVYNLYKTTFNRINRAYNVDMFKDYKIIYSIGSMSGYTAYKYILNNKIDYALLDITLGDIVRNSNNEIIEIDGVDIAIKLLELNPNIKFKFISSHTLNMKNYTMIYYFNKFESVTKRKISNYYIYKNGDLSQDIYNFLYGEGT